MEYPKGPRGLILLELQTLHTKTFFYMAIELSSAIKNRLVLNFMYLSGSNPGCTSKLQTFLIQNPLTYPLQIQFILCVSKNLMYCLH